MRARRSLQYYSRADAMPPIHYDTEYMENARVRRVIKVTPGAHRSAVW